MSALARDPDVTFGPFSGMNHSVPDSMIQIRLIDLLLADGAH
jgi:hypothetical protein